MTNNPAIDLLEKEYNTRKRENPMYSLRAFAKKLDIPSGRLSEIINGKRNLSYKVACKIATGLSWSPKQSSEFLSLVLGDKHQITIDPTIGYTELEEDQFDLIADWYHTAILSLFETSDFQNSAQWIASRLGISHIEVNSALKRLERLELVVKTEEFYALNTQGTSIPGGVPSKALRKSHEQELKLAMSSLEEVEMELRDISSMIMAIDLENIDAAKEKIRNFRHELCDLLEKGNQSEVYSLNIQLIPLSKTRGQH